MDANYGRLGPLPAGVTVTRGGNAQLLSSVQCNAGFHIQQEPWSSLLLVRLIDLRQERASCLCHREEATQIVGSSQDVVPHEL